MTGATRANEDFANEPVEEGREAAEEAGLIYVTGDEPGISRRPTASGFAYYNSQGRLVQNERTLDRIRALAIPPAYTNVWICSKSNGHSSNRSRFAGTQTISLSSALD
jgi:DNA topoisomerase I